MPAQPLAVPRNSACWYRSFACRYDRLVGMFSGKEVPAVGVSIGIERVFAIMEAQMRAEAEQVSGLGKERGKVVGAGCCDIAREGNRAFPLPANVWRWRQPCVLAPALQLFLSLLPCPPAPLLVSDHGEGQLAPPAASPQLPSSHTFRRQIGANVLCLQAGGTIRETETEVLVASIGNGRQPRRMQLCATLWAAGLKAEFGYKANPKMADQVGGERQAEVQPGALGAAWPSCCACRCRAAGYAADPAGRLGPASPGDCIGAVDTVGPPRPLVSLSLASVAHRTPAALLLTLILQLGYALKQGIPYMVLFGDTELAAGVVKVKDLDAGSEKVVPEVGCFLSSPPFSRCLHPASCFLVTSDGRGAAVCWNDAFERKLAPPHTHTLAGRADRAAAGAGQD